MIRFFAMRLLQLLPHNLTLLAQSHPPRNMIGWFKPGTLRSPSWAHSRIVWRQFLWGNPHRSSVSNSYPITTLLISRSFCCQTRIRKDYQNQNQYDQLLRQQIIKSTMNNPSFLAQGAQSFQDNRKLSFKTIILLIIASSSLTMLGYVIAQAVKISKSDESDLEEVPRSIFLPLWVNFNWWYQSTYSFPSGLQYFDPDFYKYMEIEMEQLSKTEPEKTYILLLQSENIKYKILEELSMHSTVRQLFGLPLNVSLSPDSDFNMWIESKYVSVSGLKFDFDKESGLELGSVMSNCSVNWSIKPINFISNINSALVQAGLKLDRLASSNANAKTHEKGSGRVHEVPVTDHTKRKLSQLAMSGNKDYIVAFSGSFQVKDKNNSNEGTVTYKGVLDFDHLMINRGVKLVEMNLIIQTSEPTNYKLI